MNNTDENLTEDKYAGKICPNINGTCDRKCGYIGHAVIKHGHPIIKCSKCDDIISECKCVTQGIKAVEYQICDKCK